MSRLIVFGNRDFPNRKLVEDELKLHVERGTYRTIVHGACLSGADRYASDWVKAYKSPRPFMVPVVEEPHPADFAWLGPKAGPLRNEEMVKLGAAFALGFWDGLVRGTVGRGSRDMLGRLLEARIPVTVHPPDRRGMVMLPQDLKSPEEALARAEEFLSDRCAVNALLRAVV